MWLLKVKSCIYQSILAVDVPGLLIQHLPKAATTCTVASHLHRSALALLLELGVQCLSVLEESNSRTAEDMRGQNNSKVIITCSIIGGSLRWNPDSEGFPGPVLGAVCCTQSYKHANMFRGVAAK